MNKLNEGYLYDWYINSIPSQGNMNPIWTKEHIDELLKDFDVIQKNEPDYKAMWEELKNRNTNMGTYYEIQEIEKKHGIEGDK